MDQLENIIHRGGQDRKRLNSTAFKDLKAGSTKHERCWVPQNVLHGLLFYDFMTSLQHHPAIKIFYTLYPTPVLHVFMSTALISGFKIANKISIVFSSILLT